ncbi:hypothetical protein ACVWZ8_003127 [Arthrobacter sp. UYCu723]
MALNHTNTGADQRKPWARTPALTRTTHGPLKNEYSLLDHRVSVVDAEVYGDGVQGGQCG